MSTASFQCLSVEKMRNGGGGFSRRGPPAEKAATAQIDSYVHALYPPNRVYHVYRGGHAAKLPPISSEAACQPTPVSAAELLNAVGPSTDQVGVSAGLSRKRMRCPLADAAVAPLITPAAWNAMSIRLPSDLRVFVHPSAGPDAARESLGRLVAGIKSSRRPKREKPVRRGSLVTFSGQPVALGSFSKPSQLKKRQKAPTDEAAKPNEDDEIPLDAPDDGEDSASSFGNDDDDDNAGGDDAHSGSDDIADDNF